MQAILFAALSIFLLLVGLDAQANTLSAKVEHSDQVAPIEVTLEPGDLFDAKNLPHDNDDPDVHDWYEIPSWLAGKWHKESQTDYYLHNYLTNTTDNTRRVREARSDGSWGTQQGIGGHIWQFDAVPYCQTVDSDDETIVQIVRLNESLECSEDRFVKRSIDTQIRVDKATNRIKTVETGEQITILSPESDTMLKRQTSSKVFDQTGKPTLLGLSLAFETKLGPFEPQNFYHGQDTHKLFLEFMKNSGILGESVNGREHPNLIAHLLAQ